ncbi:MAG TPA: benzoyl-CoA reductase, bzd-type, subunit Q, partial [Oxalobacteraceae bacterium]|nr:benzoyl-CoA reductase, bzd-type, subunit Q [Oxalobacteraceae bacterium]
CWLDESKDWRAAKIITAGIDVGSVSSQAVICVDGELFGYNSMRTGNNSPDSATNAINGILDKAGMKLEEVHYVIGTGYGRVNVPFAHKAITEIACHARGANYMGGPTVRTILDMGGQDCKAIHCDEKGKVTNFLMNDKCAAGTGRGMEVIADLMQIPIAELGPRSFDVDIEPPAVSSTCVVFAKSEALGLLKAGYTKNKVIAAYCQAMAERVVSLISRIGVENDFFITGGIAKNPGVVKRIERLLGTTAVATKYDSQIAGALGAALFAYTLMQKQAATAKATVAA